MNFKHILTLIEEHYRFFKLSDSTNLDISALVDQCIVHLKKNRLKKSMDYILSAYELIMEKNRNSNEIFTILALITLIHNVNDIKN